MVYGPIAAWLVELFPARIRYTSMSLPYHIGNGWFGGFLPTVSFALVALTGDIYYGLWYPIVVAVATTIIGALFLPRQARRSAVRSGFSLTHSSVNHCTSTRRFRSLSGPAGFFPAATDGFDARRVDDPCSDRAAPRSPRARAGATAPSP